MSGFSRDRRHWLAAALSALFVVGLMCVSAPAGAKKPEAGKSKTDTSAACRRGKALFALGRFGAAEAAFEKDVETGATIKCGREGLRKIGHNYPCVAARSLAKNGEKAESNKAYIELLKVKPRKQCAREGADLSSDPDVWERLKTATEDATTAIGFAALAVAVLVALGLVLLNLQARIPGLKRLWPAARIRRPALSIQLLGDSGLGEQKLSSVTTALLKEKIEPGSGKNGLTVSGKDSPEESWIQRVGEIGEPAKIGAALVAFLATLLPRRRIKLSGEIQPKGKASGPGISVELDRKFISEGSVTIWAKDFYLPVDGEDDVDTVRRLTTPAAAWVSHKTTDATGGEPLAAGRAMSWARFRAGFDWEQDGEREMAKKLYGAAIAMDDKNYAARVNLGILRAGDGDYPGALELIERALAIIEAGR
jgi:tetratricopeptide (TPR) repeat protein